MEVLRNHLGVRRVVALAIAAAVAFALVAYATNSSSNAAPSATAAAASKCGLGNGKKATGTPIKLGAIATKLPGDGLHGHPQHGRQAYFACVNATAASRVTRCS